MKTSSGSLLLFALIALSLTLSACGSTSRPASPAATSQPTGPVPVIVYSDEAYPPYSYQEGGQPKGIYVEILKVAFSRLNGYTVTIKPVPWKRGLGYLESGIGFALFPPYYHPEKRPWMDVSVPILDEALTVFCNADVLQTPRPNWPQDYQGLKVGNNLGFSTFKETPEELHAQYDITIEEAQGSDTNLLKLARKEIDCYDNDKFSILWELQRLKAAGKYTPGSNGQVEIMEATKISAEQGHVGYTNTDQGRFPYRKDFQTQLDKILTAMKDSGEIQKIVDQFINQP